MTCLKQPKEFIRMQDMCGRHCKRTGGKHCCAKPAKKGFSVFKDHVFYGDSTVCQT